MTGPSSYLLVGLGNPGKRYQFTRHNIGFMVADRLVEKYHNALWTKTDRYETCNILIDDKPVVIAKPLTYMNNSGVAVAELMVCSKIPADHLLVILDDFYLPYGNLRIRSKGSDGGHNGLASIIEQLDSTAFARLRVGIGRDDIADAAEFVLSEFGDDERSALPDVIERCSEACAYFLAQGLNETMNRFNRTLID
jgi:PTH1 family peptidyl-tRNA hydrolase